MATAGADPAEHLGVEVDEFAWPLALIADHRLPGLKTIKPRDPGSSQKGVDGRACQPRLPGKHVRPDAQLTPPGAQSGDQIG